MMLRNGSVGGRAGDYGPQFNVWNLNKCVLISDITWKYSGMLKSKRPKSESQNPKFFFQKIRIWDDFWRSKTERPNLEQKARSFWLLGVKYN